MENSKRPGMGARSMEGKGFYIVLLLCAAVIGASAWILLSDVGTNVEETEAADIITEVPAAAVTMVPAGTPVTPTAAPRTAAEPSGPDADEEAAARPDEEPAQEVFGEAVLSYVWPMRGDIELPYAVQTLLYDPTMADWRTHDGIDIACSLGDEVIASAGGTVVSVRDDDLLGTVVEIDHANGIHTVYANLAPEPPVSEGAIVTMGQTIGSVGGTALGETNEAAHLHFAVKCDGLSADPMGYLPPAPVEE